MASSSTKVGAIETHHVLNSTSWTNNNKKIFLFGGHPQQKCLLVQLQNAPSFKLYFFVILQNILIWWSPSTKVCALWCYCKTHHALNCPFFIILENIIIWWTSSTKVGAFWCYCKTLHALNYPYLSF